MMGLLRRGKNMKNLRKLGDHDPVTWLSCGVILLSVFQVAVECMVIRENPVRLRVLEYSSKNGSLSRVLNSRYSDIVVGEEVEKDSQVVLECSSNFGPLRWLYAGIGHPDHKSYYTSRTRADTTSSYTAYLSFPNGLQPKDTGEYTCQNSYNSSLNNYIYIYVPKNNTEGKPSLFVPNHKRHDVVVSSGQKTARIPCSVVHPNVKVSLERVSPQKSFWLEPPTEIPFNPKTGFVVPVSPSAREVYTCRGELNGQFEEVTYVTSPLMPRIDPDVELLDDVLHHNQHRHRPINTFNRTTSTTTAATTSAPLSKVAISIRPTKQPAPESHLISACTPTFCGSNAECIVKDYKPYCVCLEDYTGEPQTGCHRISDHSQHLRVVNPCHPSPCGKHAECLQINGHPLCTCQEGYYGSPPKCSAHKIHNCAKNYDCEWTEYCNTETRTCEDICEGKVKFCGKNALCTAFSHMPYCTCPPGGQYHGDPYDTEGSGCQVQNERVQAEGKPSCNPSPCGRNAHCKVYSSYPLPICFCPQGFTGDPSHRCYKLSPAPIIDVFRPHYNKHPPPPPTTQVTTTTTTDFSAPSAASSSLIHHHYPIHPITLCTPEFCGENARCRFRNNHPECYCLNGYKGDPYKGCHRQTISPVALRQACSVCGPNSVCSMISSDVRCVCAPDTIGAPPNCKKLSSLSSNVASTASSSTSQQNHQVSVVSTSSSHSSSALAHHLHQIHFHDHQHKIHNLQHNLSSSFFHHLHRQHFLLDCDSDLDCPDELVCYTEKQKCLNPCSWACSDSASCIVVNHHVQCRCPSGYKGDPRIECVRREQQQQPVPLPPSSPPKPEGDQQQIVPENHPCRFTCGPHTICRRIPTAEMNRLRRMAFSMESLDMEKDPLQKALLTQIKRIVQQNPTRNGVFTECMCMRDAEGNPYSIEGCTLRNSSSSSVNIHGSSSEHNKIFDDLEQSPSSTSSFSSSSIVIPTDPCSKSSNPCGPNSICVPHKGLAYCKCDYDATGEPPNCKLRCGKEQHCLFDQVCMHGQCVDAPEAASADRNQEMQEQPLKEQFDNNFLK